MSKYIDLTHTFGSSMPGFPGDPTPTLKQVAFLDKEGYVDHEIKTSMHLGTHIDAPMHMVKDGKSLAEIAPEKFFGPGVLIDARSQMRDSHSLSDRTNYEKKYFGVKLNFDVSFVLEQSIVLIFTGSSERYGFPEYYESYPELSYETAEALVNKKIKVVGFDTPSPDRQPFRVHKLLLSKEILIIENLTNLEKLLDVPSFEVVALPFKLDADAAPVRVVARI